MTADWLFELLTPAVSAHIAESESTLFIVATAEGSLTYVNLGARELLGIDGELEEDCFLWDLLTAAEADRMKEMIAHGVDALEVCSINFVGAEHLPETFNCRVWMREGHVAILGDIGVPEALELRRKLIETNNELVVNSRELARRTRELEHARETLQSTLEELESSYWHLKKIQEVLPICMGCKKVKTSEATWEDVVDYLEQNALFLSHGYCPDCAQELLDEYHATGEKDNAQ
jgi:hypothetical protein